MYIGLGQETRAYYDGNYICLLNKNSGAFRLLTSGAAVFVYLLNGCRDISDVKRDFLYVTDSDEAYFEKILSNLSGYIYSSGSEFSTGINEIEKTHLVSAKPVEEVLENEQPCRVMIYTTNLCDKNCKYCWENQHMNSKRKGSFPVDLVDKLMTNINLNNINFTLTGGEPLLCKDLGRVISAFNKHGVPVSLTTKASGNYSYFDSIIRSNVNYVCFSIDSSDEAYVNYITDVPDIFENIVNCMQIAKRRGINIGVNSVIMSENRNDIEELIQFCIRQNVIDLHFAVVLPTAKMDEGLWLTEQEKTQVYSFINNARKKYAGLINIELTSSNCSMKNRCKKCGKNFTDVKVDFDGDVMLCNGQVIGNLYQNDLCEIWNSRHAKESRRMVMEQIAV